MERDTKGVGRDFDVFLYFKRSSLLGGGGKKEFVFQGFIPEKNKRTNDKDRKNDIIERISVKLCTVRE